MSNVLCVGGGRTGLPLSLCFWAAGHDVTVLDTDGSIIRLLRTGKMPFRDPGTAAILERAYGNPRFGAITYQDGEFEERMSSAQYVLLTLGTSLRTDNTFGFDRYLEALRRAGPHLRHGVTIVVHGTVAPHFTRNVVTTQIGRERNWVVGSDFFVSFCPDPLPQKNAVRDVSTLPDIVGADDSKSASRVQELFASINAGKLCHELSIVEAELAKLFMSTFRYTMLGLSNEFALIAEEYGANIDSILRAANAGYPRGGIPTPGPSRGPHLGKDAAVLAFSSSSSLISHAAIKTNENIVLHAMKLIRAALGTVVGQRVCIFGLAFEGDSDDVRDSLTTPLVNLLDREGAETRVFDPLVPGHDDPAVAVGSDAVVLMTPHRDFKLMDEPTLLATLGQPRNLVRVIDMWNIWPGADKTFGSG